jgi:glycine/D-amino acid oxidase-like deaminating enzyme
MPKLGSPWWRELTPAKKRPKYPACRGELTADVVVIGGGLTGTVAAYVLARGGLDVVLVEAERLADAGTAAGLGCVVPDPAASFLGLHDAVGLRATKDAWRAARASARDLAAGIKRLGIRCDATPAAVVTDAAYADRTVELRREQSARKAAGFAAPWLKGAGLDALLASEALGAIRVDGATMLDPVKAALGFAKAADAAGARIFESSPVRRTRFDRKSAEVVLANAKIATSGIFVATGSPGRLFSQLRRHVREQDAFVVVTEPLDTGMKRQTGKRQAIVTEVSDTPHWLRWLKGDRAMFAGAVGPAVSARQLDKVLIQKTGQLMYELSLRHPAISGLPAAASWAMRVVSTQDGLPWIGVHRNYPFHFFAIALGWHGETFAWHAARAALRRFAGKAEKDDAVFGFNR